MDEDTLEIVNAIAQNEEEIIKVLKSIERQLMQIKNMVGEIQEKK